MAKWILINEKGKLRIRKDSGPRYPLNKYKDLIDKRELEDLVIRLNGKDPVEERARGPVEFKHAFINSNLLDDYKLYLESQIPTKKDAGTMLGYLMKTLNYFIGVLNLSNPSDWHKRQHIWAKHLLSTKYSKKTLKSIVYELNRFIKYLHQQRPEEVIPLKFEPLSKATLKLHEAKRTPRQNMYITEDDFKKLQKILKGDALYPVLMLACCYGLRRNEVLGLRLEDVRKDFLRIERQYGDRPLKGRYNRKVPHWFCTAAQAYHWIEILPKLHPDTVTAKFTALMQEHKLPKYILHDTRRTFITKSSRKVTPTDLRLAVGHTNLETTSKYYLMDDRELGDEPFKPKK